MSVTRPDITLSDADLLSQGGGRKIYNHPDRPDVVIKLHKPLNEKQFQWLRTALRYHRRRFGSLMNSFVEIEEFAAIVARSGQVPAFATQFLGFTQTNLGAGAMYEAIKRPNGKLATTLSAHARKHGIEAPMERAIDDLWDQVMAARAVVADPSLRNVVVTGSAADGYQLVVVDGLGERTVIPLQSLSKWLHRKSCDKARIAMQLAYRTRAQAR